MSQLRKSTCAPTCALCGKPEDALHKPFCSQGCRDRDLLNWLGEGYAIPATHGTEEDDAASDSLG